MTKSHITVEQHICVVCAEPYDTGSLLLDKYMRDKFEQNTITGWGMCEEHAKLKKDNYVALVGIDEQKSGVFSKSRTVDPTDVHRLGTYIHIKSEMFEDIFDVALPETMVAFIDEALVNALIDLVRRKAKV